MKNTIATFITIVGIGILTFFPEPIYAQHGVVAALYQHDIETTQNNQLQVAQPQLAFAMDTSIETGLLIDSLLDENQYDRMVMLDPASKVACLVYGNGSLNGEVLCGVIDDHD